MSAAALYLLLLHQTDTHSLPLRAKWTRNKTRTASGGKKSTNIRDIEDNKHVGLSCIMTHKLFELQLMTDVLAEKKVNTKITFLLLPV